MLRYKRGVLRMTSAKLEHNHVLSPRLSRHYVKNRKIPKEISAEVMSLVGGRRPVPDIVEEVKGMRSLT